MPLISVVIPVYNADKYLEECLDSVIRQTYTDIEIICVNDGSTDKTLDILNEYKTFDSRIKVFSKKNEGFLGRTINFGLERVAPEVKYIARMDANDICVSSRLAEQYAFMEENPEVDISGTDMLVFENSYYKNAQRVVSLPARPTSYDILKRNSDLAHPTVIFRASFIRKKKLSYSEKFKLEDKELWMRAVFEHSATIANINKPLLYYRVIRNSLSHDPELFKVLKKEWDECSAKYLNFLKDKNPLEYEKVLDCD